MREREKNTQNPSNYSFATQVLGGAAELRGMSSRNVSEIAMTSAVVHSEFARVDCIAHMHNVLV